MDIKISRFRTDSGNSIYIQDPLQWQELFIKGSAQKRLLESLKSIQGADLTRRSRSDSNLNADRHFRGLGNKKKKRVVSEYPDLPSGDGGSAKDVDGLIGRGKPKFARARADSFERNLERNKRFRG